MPEVDSFYLAGRQKSMHQRPVQTQRIKFKSALFCSSCMNTLAARYSDIAAFERITRSCLHTGSYVLIVNGMLVTSTNSELGLERYIVHHGIDAVDHFAAQVPAYAPAPLLERLLLECFPRQPVWSCVNTEEYTPSMQPARVLQFRAR